MELGNTVFQSFLDASTHHKRVYPSVGPSLVCPLVCPLVHWSVGPWVHYSFSFYSAKLRENGQKWFSMSTILIFHAQSVFQSHFPNLSFTKYIFHSLSFAILFSQTFFRNFLYNLSYTISLSQLFFHNLSFTTFLSQSFFTIFLSQSCFHYFSRSDFHDLSFTIFLSQSLFSIFAKFGTHPKVNLSF